MIKKMIAVFTTMTAALLVVGVAWAGSDDRPSSTSIDDTATTSVTVDDAPTAGSGSGSVTSTSLDDATPTTIDDHGNDNTTPTTIDDHGNDNTTPTTIDDHGNDNATAEDSVATYSLPPVGTVTVEVTSGKLHIVDVNAPGWEVTVRKARSDRVRIEFRSGETEAEFEAELQNGAIDVDFEVDSV